MQKNFKAWLLPIITFLAAPFAMAADGATPDGVAGIFVNIFGIFGFFSFISIDKNPEMVIIFTRLVIWLMVFSLLYVLTSRVLHDANKGVRIMIPLVIAFMTILVPDTLIKTFFIEYTTIFWFIMLGIPIVGGIWLVLQINPATMGRGAHFLRAAILFLLAYIVNEITSIFEEVAGSGSALGISGGFAALLFLNKDKIKRWFK